MRVNSVTEGEGILAYCHIHAWFTGMNGQGTSAIAQQPMHPIPPKQYWQIAEALDKWSEALRNLEHVGDELKMAVQYRIEASRRLMVTQRAMLCFETIENQTKLHLAGPDTISGTFQEFFQ